MLAWPQIRPDVEKALKKSGTFHAVGIHSTESFTGDRQLQSAGRTYQIMECVSPLAVREALHAPLEPGAVRIVITPLDESALGDEILVRMCEGGLIHVNPWHTVEIMFQAHSVDKRLIAFPNVANLLIQMNPGEGFPPALGGHVDADFVWPIILERKANFPAGLLDLAGLLRWSADQNNVRSYMELDPEVRRGAESWLELRLGPAIHSVIACLSDALPAGLAIDVLQSHKASELDRALIRFEERYLGGRNPGKLPMKAWAQSSRDVLKLMITNPDEKRQVVERTDGILKELGVSEFTYISDVSAAGFQQRITRFSRTLLDCMKAAKRSSSAAQRDLVAMRESLRSHDESRHHPRTMVQIDMTIRLFQWLRGSTEDAPQAFGDVLRAEWDEMSLVDWARLALRGSGENQEFAEACKILLAETSGLREKRAHKFAQSLARWTQSGSESTDVICVEKILEKIVAPIAKARKVLLIVMDGMSAAASQEILHDLAANGWYTLSAPDNMEATMPIGLATIPSVTEVSRASLLCGKLSKGAATIEKAGFSAHPRLLEHCKAAFPPVLFHKIDLRSHAGIALSEDVREAIQEESRQVVGVVVNAIDDHLTRGDQVNVEWTLDNIPMLRVLLHEARSSGRVVVMTSDHGHILESDTTYRAGTDGERWRSADGSVSDDELLIHGTRLLDQKQIIVPWSENVRYGMKKNGYHGGINPQEMLVPILILWSVGAEPAPNWREAATSLPAWWQLDAGDYYREPPLPTTRHKLAAATGMPDLFSYREEVATLDPPKASKSKWISELQASDMYKAQKKIASRTCPPDEEIAALLSALEARGWKTTEEALVGILRKQPFRIQGFVATVQRLLNVDGYGVITRDDLSATVELNKKLLFTQFGIKDD